MKPAITITDDSGVSVVELQGEHDLATASEVRDALESALTERRAVVVELTLTDFIDSSILGVLLAGLRRAREASLGFVFVVQGDDGRARQPDAGRERPPRVLPGSRVARRGDRRRPGRHESARPGT